MLPGSTAVVRAHLPVPGDYKLVDHALIRVVRKGALADIHAEGRANPDVVEPQAKPRWTAQCSAPISLCYFVAPFDRMSNPNSIVVYYLLLYEIPCQYDRVLWVSKPPNELAQGRAVEQQYVREASPGYQCLW